MPARSQVQPPYTIDTAVSDEAEFWAHIGELIDEAVAKAFERHGVKDATQSMKVVAASQKVVIERLNRLDLSHGQMAVDLSRIAGWTTAKEFKDALLDQKITRLLEVLTPPMMEPEPPAPTPPDTETKK